MNNNNLSSSAADRLIIRGIHLDLTEALKNAVTEKTARLFRHQEQIVRLRLDIEHDKTRHTGQRFVAKGHIEIGGPDLLASVASDDAYKSIDMLVDKLDGLLRRRASHRKDNLHHPHGIDIPADLPKVT
jgi:putative sigma-54 modulation protein